MTLGVVNLRAWPGSPNPRELPTSQPAAPERLIHHGGLVLVLVAERGAVPERVGLGICLLVLGPTVTRVALIVDDDLDARHPKAFGLLQDWAAATTYVSPRGMGHVAVMKRSGFCHPDDGPVLRAYTGGAFLLTADEGRSLGLLAEHWAPARGRFAGGFSMGLPGWGELATRTDNTKAGRPRWQALAHRPVLRAKALGGHGMVAEWARACRGGRLPNGAQAGHWERDRPFLGRIIDLIGPAFALDGIDTSDLAEHLGAFGLPAHSVPASLPVGPEAAGHLLAVARAIHDLALALDEEAIRWW